MTATEVRSALKGPEKAVLFLLAAEPELAAEILSQFDEDTIRRLAATAKDLSPSATDALDGVCEEFSREMEAPLLLRTRGAESYLSGLTEKALGPERARKVLTAPKKVEAIEALKAARTQTLAELLAEEHPQVAAVITSQLPRPQAAKVIGLMPEERQADLLRRIAALAEIPKELVDSASDALAKAIAAAGAPEIAAPDEFNGVAFAAGLLNEMTQEKAERILGTIAETHSTLAPKVRQAMFTFEDLSKVSARGIQALLRDVASDRLVVALKTASESLREHFFGAVSSRAAVTLKEDLAALPPIRLSDVEEAQREIVEVALKLAAEGTITLPGGSGEKLV